VNEILLLLLFILRSFSLTTAVNHYQTMFIQTHPLPLPFKQREGVRKQWKGWISDQDVKLVSSAFITAKSSRED
jgi:hypothetical protein